MIAHNPPDDKGFVNIAFDSEDDDTAYRVIAELEGLCLRLHFRSGNTEDIIFGCLVENDEGQKIEGWLFDESKPQDKGALVYFDLDTVETLFVY